jgi:hypothetical protein
MQMARGKGAPEGDAVNWPWNVRVTASPNGSRIGRELTCRPDYYIAEVRIRGRWYDAGTGKTWLETFLMGLVA